MDHCSLPEAPGEFSKPAKALASPCAKESALQGGSLGIYLAPSDGARPPRGHGAFGSRETLQLAESTLGFGVKWAKLEFGGQRAGSSLQDRCVCETLFIHKAPYGLKHPLGMRQLKSE